MPLQIILQDFVIYLVMNLEIGLEMDDRAMELEMKLVIGQQGFEASSTKNTQLLNGPNEIRENITC